ncbi:MAG: hypothetical protein HFI37_05750 [Lachnospiraceae bacterium]|nr:hypothetical protein [Lachnospiraceae bacterium]
MNQDMPVGFSFALGENERALAQFAEMTDQEKKQVLETARAVQSKRDMRSLVDQIAKLEG